MAVPARARRSGRLSRRLAAAVFPGLLLVTSAAAAGPRTGTPGPVTTPDSHIGRPVRAAADRRRPNPMHGPGGGLAVVARWLLLGAVITGVLVMHILSAADSGGSHQPTAMTAAATAGSPAMSMSMSVPDTDMAPPAFPKLSGDAGGGMSPMSCCVLFLVPAVGLVLLMRSTKAAATANAGEAGGRAAPSAVPQRGPPAPRRPRIALSVLRV